MNRLRRLSGLLPTLGLLVIGCGFDQGSRTLTSGHAELLDGYLHYGSSGFQFSSQKVVGWGSGRSDILVAGEPPWLFLQFDEAPRDTEGADQDARCGIQEMEATLLVAVTECPQTDYEYHWFEPRVGGVYCLRTRDGKHYAKLSVTEIDEARGSLSFDWVFQQSGSRRF